MTDAVSAAKYHSYFLAEGDRRVVTWLAFSLAAHFAFFAFAWWETQRPREPLQLCREAIMVQPVAWAPEERPKHLLPRKDAPLENMAANADSIKVEPNPAKPEKSDAMKRAERRDRMQAALERMRTKNPAIHGGPNGIRGGISSRALQVLGSVYAARLRDVFKARWAVPSVISENELKSLRCKILVKIDLTGKIIKHKLIEESGNQQFDSSALAAVKLTPEVPLPDEVLQDLVFQEGILINFLWKD